MRRHLLAAATSALCGAVAAAPLVIVYGSSPAGIAAAVAAGRMGLRVSLYEPLRMIGGMGAAGNLALNDGGVTAERTGLAREFSLLNGAAYGLKNKEVPHPESFVAEASFNTMLAAANVSVQLDCRLLSATTFTGGDGASRIASLSLSCEPQPVVAAVFIDASYDGEIVVAAGDIPYTAGREANTTYNESLAGARVPSWEGVAGPHGVDALDARGRLIKYVANLTELPPPGSADDALMVFQHRLCISADSDRVPWPAPPGYDPADFALLAHALAANKNDPSFFTALPPPSLPGYPGPKKKYCACCGITVAATDQPMLNAGWASASWEQRQAIVAAHTYFELGSFHFMANDPSVPADVRARFSDYGLCGDEFKAFGHVPPQLYVRISNRLVGDVVLTQNTIANPRAKPDSVGVADWEFDGHMTGKYAVPTAGGAGQGVSYEVMLEGNFRPPVSPDGVNWYDVPYSALLPKRGTGANLIVPVALSASAVAYTSARIENMFMSLGTAAGVAAAQVVVGGVAAVQDVNVTAVQQTLAGPLFRQRVHGPPGSGSLR